MKPIFILMILILSCTSALFAEGHDEVTFAGQINSKFFPFSKLAEGFDPVTATYGVRMDYLHELSPEFWVGGGYTRFRGAFKNTESNVEFAEAIAEKFFGNREKLVDKGPFWEKLFYKVGGRGGLHRWVVQSKQSGILTELNYGPTYYSFGWTVAPYAAVGLGELGYIEYTQRMHFSGGADMSALNNVYLSYVYGLTF